MKLISSTDDRRKIIYLTRIEAVGIKSILRIVVYNCLEYSYFIYIHDIYLYIRF